MRYSFVAFVFWSGTNFLSFISRSVVDGATRALKSEFAAASAVTGANRSIPLNTPIDNRVYKGFMIFLTVSV